MIGRERITYLNESPTSNWGDKFLRNFVIFPTFFNPNRAIEVLFPLFNLHRLIVFNYTFISFLNSLLFHFKISEDVTRKRSEYQKHLEYYKLLRSKFEEHYIKGKNMHMKIN